MMRSCCLTIVLFVLAFAGGIVNSPNPAAAASPGEISRDCERALDNLFAKSQTAKVLGENSKGVLVFPSIVKGGFLVGGQYGEGALLSKGKSPGVYKVAGYYNTVQVSYGLQAGLQKYGYALFFMTEPALKWIDRSDGWELGTGPSIVIVDVDMAKSFSTTTLQSEIYAFFFDQKGLMAGLGLQGTKVTRIEK